MSLATNFTDRPISTKFDLYSKGNFNQTDEELDIEENINMSVRSTGKSVQYLAPHFIYIFIAVLAFCILLSLGKAIYNYIHVSSEHRGLTISTNTETPSVSRRNSASGKQELDDTVMSNTEGFNTQLDKLRQLLNEINAKMDASRDTLHIPGQPASCYSRPSSTDIDTLWSSIDFDDIDQSTFSESFRKSPTERSVSPPISDTSLNASRSRNFQTHPFEPPALHRHCVQNVLAEDSPRTTRYKTMAQVLAILDIIVTKSQHRDMRRREQRSVVGHIQKSVNSSDNANTLSNPSRSAYCEAYPSISPFSPKSSLRDSHYPNPYQSGSETMTNGCSFPTASKSVVEIHAESRITSADTDISECKEQGTPNSLTNFETLNIFSPRKSLNTNQLRPRSMMCDRRSIFPVNVKKSSSDTGVMPKFSAAKSSSIREDSSIIHLKEEDALPLELERRNSKTSFYSLDFVESKDINQVIIPSNFNTSCFTTKLIVHKTSQSSLDPACHSISSVKLKSVRVRKSLSESELSNMQAVLLSSPLHFGKLSSIRSLQQVAPSPVLTFTHTPLLVSEERHTYASITTTKVNSVISIPGNVQKYQFSNTDTVQFPAVDVKIRTPLCQIRKFPSDSFIHKTPTLKENVSAPDELNWSTPLALDSASSATSIASESRDRNMSFSSDEKAWFTPPLPDRVGKSLESIKGKRN